MQIRQLMKWTGSVLLFAGCGGAPSTTYPVEGTVTLDGQPVANGTILFEPIMSGNQAFSARGNIERGQYRLSTFATADGAAAAEYRVAVIVPMPGGSSEAGGTFLPRPAKLVAYGDVATSKLTANVAPQADANRAVNFQLISK